MTVPVAAGAAPPAVAVEAGLPGEFERLRRFVTYHLGRFTLGLVRVNDPRQREGFIDSLADALAADGVRLIRLNLTNRHPESLRDALRFGPPDLPASASNPLSGAALAVTGMEHLIEREPDGSGRPPFAAALNHERDSLRAALRLPVILFLTDHAMDRLDLAAPDFFDWYSGIFSLRQHSPSGRTLPATTRELRSSDDGGTPAGPLSAETVAERLDVLEDRRAELERAGPAAGQRLAQVLREMGDLHAGSREFHDRQAAISYLKEAADRFHEAGDQAEEAAALYALAQVCYWIYDYLQANRRLARALPMYREIGARLGEANCMKAFGDVHLQLDEYGPARARYEEALPVFREIGDRLGEANCIKSLGDVHLQMAEYSQARARYEEALPVYREIGARLGEANTLAAMGQIMFVEDNQIRSGELLADAVAIYQSIGDRYSEAAATGNYGWALRRVGDQSKARPYLLRAAEMFQGIGMPDRAARHRQAADGKTSALSRLRAWARRLLNRDR